MAVKYLSKPSWSYSSVDRGSLMEQEYRWLKEQGYKAGKVTIIPKTTVPGVYPYSYRDVLVKPNKVKYQGKPKKRDVNKRTLAGG